MRAVRNYIVVMKIKETSLRYYEGRQIRQCHEVEKKDKGDEVQGTRTCGRQIFRRQIFHRRTFRRQPGHFADNAFRRQTLFR